MIPRKISSASRVESSVFSQSFLALSHIFFAFLLHVSKILPIFAPNNSVTPLHKGIKRKADV